MCPREKLPVIGLPPEEGSDVSLHPKVDRVDIIFLPQHSGHFDCVQFEVARQYPRQYVHLKNVPFEPETNPRSEGTGNPYPYFPTSKSTQKAMTHRVGERLFQSLST